MKYQDIISQILIFLASISSTLYLIFSNDEGKEEIKRRVLAAKILGAVIVAFFIMPFLMEHFNLSIKGTLFLTVIIAYGLESLLKTCVKFLIKKIDKDGEDVSNN